MNCECVKKLNASEAMAKNNAYIATATMINFETGAAREVINIPLERRSSRGMRLKTKFITANYCPFCGISQAIQAQKK